MPNIDITPGTGKTVSTTPVGTSTGVYSTSGEAASGVIYCSSATAIAPTPVTNANPFPVGVQGTAAVTQSGTWNVAATQSGTWNVGTVTTVSTVTAVTTLSTLTTVTNPVITSLNSAAINNGTTALTPKFAQVTTSATGDTQVVAAVAGKQILVLSYSVSFNATGTVYFKTAATGTQLSRNIYGTQFASQGQSFSPVGHFRTLVGEALSINLSGASPASVNVCYVEV